MLEQLVQLRVRGGAKPHAAEPPADKDACGAATHAHHPAGDPSAGDAPLARLPDKLDRAVQKGTQGFGLVLHGRPTIG